MSVKFAVIYNPVALFLKFEVWAKGVASLSDSLGQPIGEQDFCQKARSFRTMDKAKVFVEYQEAVRAFTGQRDTCHADSLILAARGVLAKA